MSIAIGILFVVLVSASIALRRLKRRRQKTSPTVVEPRLLTSKQMQTNPGEPLTQAVLPIHTSDAAPVTRYTPNRHPSETGTNQSGAMFLLAAAVGSSMPDEEERRREEEQRRREDEERDDTRRDNDRTQDEPRDRDHQRYEERSADFNNDASVDDTSSGSWD